jgi:hypothetical protein
MKKLACIALTLFWSAAGWAGHSHDLAAAAYDLKYAADQLYHQLHYQSGYSYASKGAKALAKASKRFHYSVKHGGSPHYLWKEYRSLADCFHDLRSTLHYSRDYRYVAGDFRAVEGAFSSLQRAMEYRKYSRRGHARPYASRGYYSRRYAYAHSER